MPKWTTRLSNKRVSSQHEYYAVNGVDTTAAYAAILVDAHFKGSVAFTPIYTVFLISHHVNM